MKHALMISMMFAASAFAQPRGGMMMMRSPALQALDTDGDGAVSAPEIVNAAKSLAALDKNGDGKLTENEVRPQFGGRGRGGRGEGRGELGEAAGPSAEEMLAALMAFDKNGDGKLSKDEVPERMQGLFDRADANHDGILTGDEIRKTASVAAAPEGGNGGERRGEGFRGGRGGERRSFMRMDPILAALDTDSDGEISAAELAAAPQTLKKLDKDGDGKLSGEEVRLNFGGRGRGERI